MYTAPRVKERAGAMMKGKGVKQRLQWNKSPSWHRDLSYSWPQKESRGGEEGGGGGRDAPPEKRKQKWRQRHREEEHGYRRTDVGAIFSHRLEAEWRKSQRFHCHTDFPLGPSCAISFLLTATLLLLLLFHLIPLFLPCTVNLIFLRL